MNYQCPKCKQISGEYSPEAGHVYCVACGSIQMEPTNRPPQEWMQTLPVSVLVAAANDRIDLNSLARKELAQRGLNIRGEWVGFDAAKKFQEVAE